MYSGERREAMSQEKPYWEGKNILFSVIRNVNISPAIRQMTRKILIVFFVTALCMPWETGAGEILSIPIKA